MIGRFVWQERRFLLGGFVAGVALVKLFENPALVRRRVALAPPQAWTTPR